MAQEIRFALQLSLAESYIYGSAIIDGESYLINIQQAKDQSIVLPQRHFLDIEEPNQASVSFSNQQDNNNKIGMTVGIIKGQGDIIELYVNEDNVLLALANDLPVDMILLQHDQEKRELNGEA
jgi:hypothetical protein